MSNNLLYKLINNNPAIKEMLKERVNDQKEIFLDQQFQEKKTLAGKLNEKKYKIYNLIMGGSCLLQFYLIWSFIKTNFFYGYLLTSDSWHKFLGYSFGLIVFNAALIFFQRKDSSIISEINEDKIENFLNQKIDISFDKISDIAKEVDRDDLNIYLELIKENKYLRVSELDYLLNQSQSKDVLNIKNMKTEMLNQVYKK